MEKLDSASSPGRQPPINFIFKSLGSWNKLSGFGPHLACRRVLFGLIECLGKNFKNELAANIHKSEEILHQSLDFWHLLKVCRHWACVLLTYDSDRGWGAAAA